MIDMKLRSVPTISALDGTIREVSVTQREAARELGVNPSSFRSIIRRRTIETGPLNRIPWSEVERVRAIRAGGSAVRNPLNLSGPVAA
jgi:hypothetical protein